MAEQEKSPTIVRSDSLRHFLELLEGMPGIRPLIGTIFQVLVVLDASYIQGELRWRVGSRRDPDARTSLHEAIVSGAVLAFAPTFLNREIEKYIPEIAEQSGVSEASVTQEWELLKPLIRFYEPLAGKPSLDCLDPKDAPYAHTLEELDADFVCTRDGHFVAMGLPVMPAGFDRVLRDYARATSVLLTVKLGSGFAMVCGFEIISALATVAVDAIRKLPPIVKILLGASLALALINPTSRDKIVGLLKKLSGRLQAARPVLVSLSSEAARTLASYLQVAKATGKTIADAVPVRGKLSVLRHACLVCMKADGPLSAIEISRRIRNSGYTSRSRNFPAYVRRVMRNDPRFVANSAGLWLLRGQAIAA
jgi:hypothetical protein